MRNHAARLGAYASNGCHEYTPDALHPNMMSCTACGCQRNFHRKVLMTNSDPTTTTGSINIRGGRSGRSSGQGDVDEGPNLRWSRRLAWRPLLPR
ncbi:putative zinc-finger homeodomain protein 11-like [Cocos nucifera]|uniref:Putative zinc-finger homeodomain protein 11-like n=1 Tax=Cocos nucifera TaxID=13894 RepID=A0A8K0ISY6_COCNU|nr:putative zinc-finger homeodomain protein 11-like [Cocos nucifera]